MKCEIRTVISLDDEDLINLIEKCKEKHKLAELIEKALVAYCYQGERVPESKREVADVEDSVNDLSHEIRSLAMQLAVISNNVQSNHSYVMEAIGRLSGTVEAVGQMGRISVVPVDAGDYTMGQITETHIVSEDIELDEKKEVSAVGDDKQEAEIKAETKSDGMWEAEQKAEQKSEQKAEQETESADSDSEDDEDEGLSAETAALMAQFLGA